MAWKDGNATVAARDADEPLADEVIGVVVAEQRAIAVTEFGDVMGGQDDGDAERERGHEERPHPALLAALSPESSCQPETAFLDQYRRDQRWPPLQRERAKWRQHPHHRAPPPRAA